MKVGSKIQVLKSKHKWLIGCKGVVTEITSDGVSVTLQVDGKPWKAVYDAKQLKELN